MVKYNVNVITSFVFLIPAMFSLYYGIYWHFFIILISTTLSVLYHSSKEKDFKKLDRFFATFLIISNFYLLYLSGFPLSFTISAAFFIFVGFYFLFKSKKINYALNHSLWHFSSAIVTLLCALAYSKIS